MDEYISRDAAYPLAKKICDAIDSEDFQRLNFGMRILDWIDDLPAADVRPVRSGKWMLNALESVATCSECECCVPTIWKDPDIYWNFCPNCGADMREES